MEDKKSGDLLFGTAGTPLSASGSSTQAGIERIHELGLECMEVEFVRGVHMSADTALVVGEVAARLGVRLTAHAPYFINLNAHERDKAEASRQRILEAARIASLCGGEGVVFHAAFYMGDPPDEVYAVVKTALEEIVAELRAEGKEILLRPEVTGKGSQFGTLEELLSLSAEVPGVAPCIDFAHWHARSGKFNSYQEFTAILGQVEEALGRWGVENLLLHVSGIDYGPKGERKHLILPESDFQYVDLLRALKDCAARGLVICESPSLEEDALLLQQTYRAL